MAPSKKEKSIDKLFGNASEQSLDLLKKLLTFDWKKRITVN